MTRIVLILGVLGLVLEGCIPAFVPVVPLDSLSSAERTAAANVRVFALGQSSPRVRDSFAQLTAYSCKHLLTDPPASQGDALQQLQVKAARTGANALINVTFDTRGTDTLGTNCWETVQASGTAVSIGE